MRKDVHLHISINAIIPIPAGYSEHDPCGNNSCDPANRNRMQTWGIVSRIAINQAFALSVASVVPASCCFTAQIYEHLRTFPWPVHREMLINPSALFQQNIVIYSEFTNWWCTNLYLIHYNSNHTIIMYKKKAIIIPY